MIGEIETVEEEAATSKKEKIKKPMVVYRRFNSTSGRRMDMLKVIIRW